MEVAMNPRDSEQWTLQLGAGRDSGVWPRATPLVMTSPTGSEASFDVCKPQSWK
jgi:hypothetical protein